MAPRARPANKAQASDKTHQNKSNAVWICWDSATALQWNTWIEAVEQSTIEQTWAYGEAFVGVTPYVPVHGVIYRGRAVIGVVQVVEWRIASGSAKGFRYRSEIK